MTQNSITRSWVASANGHADFPLQNLPLGVFSSNGSAPRAGVAIGDSILDLHAAIDAFDGDARRAVEATAGGQLNAFFELGRGPRVALRERLLALLGEGSPLQAREAEVLHRAADCQMHLPAKINDYTDFYVGIEHAQNVGKLFRPDNPLLPNYKYVPIGYHGRASTIRPSGTDVRRPWGQLKGPEFEAPIFAPSRRFDIELEMGAVVGQASEHGYPVTVAEADAMIFGYVLLNDWSARDIQAWEYQPLGPFQAKATATSISPWIVMKAALEPFRTPTPPREVPLLPYLQEPGPMLYDIALEIGLTPEGGEETILARTNYAEMYYSAPQQLAHHTTSGCAMTVGDLLGSGTISGPTKDSRGSLLELSWGGKEPIAIKGGTRTFIEDNDTLVLRGAAQGDGYRIGFGECVGKVTPALANPYERN